MSVEKSCPSSRLDPQAPPGSFKAERVQLRSEEDPPVRLGGITGKDIELARRISLLG